MVLLQTIYFLIVIEPEMYSASFGLNSIKILTRFLVDGKYFLCTFKLDIVLQREFLDAL